MSRILWKSFHLCFPTNLIKCSSSPCLPPPSSADDPFDPNRLSLNFNCLYDHCRRCPDDYSPGSHPLTKRLAIAPSTTTISSSTTPTTAVTTTTATSSSSSEDSDDHHVNPDVDDSPPPDFAAAFASRRFFFSSPGNSNAITESPESRSRELYDNYSTTTTITNTTTTTISTTHNVNTTTDSQNNYNTATVSRLINGGAAVKHYLNSPDPYRDFRRSMEEMIEAKDHESTNSAEFLKELLFSYLSMNPRDTHEFIIRAFTDVLVSLVSDDRRKF